MKRTAETHGKPWGALILMLVLCVFGWRMDQVQATSDGYHAEDRDRQRRAEVEPEAGQYAYWNDQVSRKILEYGLDDNPPRAARAYALQSVTFIDSLIACFDAKYAFWSRRPFQRDPTVTTLFPTPNHPSYPGAAATLSNGAAEILGYLFPREAGDFRTLAQEAANSRLWAGIHFRSDNEAGLTLGDAVAQLVIAHAREDGSE